MVLTITMASVCQQNASMELIPGMDKLLNHMKEQDKKIKTLTEENKALKEKCECVERQRDSCCDRLSEKLKEENDELQEEQEDEDEVWELEERHLDTIRIIVGKENKKLKEENKKLKEEIKCYWEVDGGMSDVSGKFPDIASHLRECFARAEGMRKRCVQRNKEVNELKEELKHKNEKFCEWIEENQKLKEWSLSTQMIEDTSAETIEEFERDVRDNWKENTEFTEEIEKLKEENDELQEESEEMEYCNGVCCERSPKHGISWWKSYGFNSPCKCAYTIKRQEENKKLEEENKKLKEKITCLESDSHNEVSQAEHEEQMENTLASLNFYKECNEELKEEIKKQKKEHIQNIMKTNKIATELYREMKYALGYGEFDEPDRKEMYEEIKKLKNDLRLCADGLIPPGMVGGIVECEREKRHKAEEEIKKLKEMSRDKVRELIKEYFHGELVGSSPCPTTYHIYDWDSEEESEDEE